MEEWKPVPGFPSHEASSLGRVRKGEKILKPSKKKANGRLVFCVRQGGRQYQLELAVAVCSAFHGERPAGMWALHKNDDKGDNTPGNLYWGTPMDNAADARKNGGHARRSKLSPEKVKLIRELSASGVTGRQLAGLFNVSPMTVSYAINRKKWVHVQ